MNIKKHTITEIDIAEIIADEVLIRSAEDGTDLLGNIYYNDFGKVILHEHQFTPDFFNLKNGLTGEVLQKFSTYRVKLAIVGNFSKYDRQSMKDFINESNKIGHVNFVSSVTDAIERLTK